MSRYRFELAKPEDDAALRGILAGTPTPGTISVRFEREPSYFGASVVKGRFRQTMVVRDTITGAVAGTGSRAVEDRYVNGNPAPIGYLSDLRLLESHRQHGLLARGYAFLYDLHRDGRTPLYLTTIAEGNDTALASLTSARAGLPMYHPLGRYHTLAIELKPRAARANIETRPATDADLPMILEYLAKTGPRRQFFPCYNESDFTTPTGLLRDLRPSDILLALRHDRIVGVFAAWDQSSFRQDVIAGYAWPMGTLRPIYNLYATLTRKPRLPRPGQRLRCLMGAIPVADAPEIVPALLRAMLNHRAGAQYDYLLLGLHDSDPLLPMIAPFHPRRYTTHLYAVCWDDGDRFRKSLDDRPMYLELGRL